jgi:hypothetical protein
MKGLLKRLLRALPNRHQPIAGTALPLLSELLTIRRSRPWISHGSLRGTCAGTAPAVCAATPGMKAALIPVPPACDHHALRFYGYPTYAVDWRRHAAFLHAGAQRMGRLQRLRRQLPQLGNPARLTADRTALRRCKAPRSLPAGRQTRCRSSTMTLTAQDVPAAASRPQTPPAEPVASDASGRIVRACTRIRWRSPSTSQGGDIVEVALPRLPRRALDRPEYALPAAREQRTAAPTSHRADSSGPTASTGEGRARFSAAQPALRATPCGDDRRTAASTCTWNNDAGDQRSPSASPSPATATSSM